MSWTIMVSGNLVFWSCPSASFKYFEDCDSARSIGHSILNAVRYPTPPDGQKLYEGYWAMSGGKLEWVAYNDGTGIEASGNDYLEDHECTCSLSTIIRAGCKCGGR